MLSTSMTTMNQIKKVMRMRQVMVINKKMNMITIMKMMLIIIIIILHL